MARGHAQIGEKDPHARAGKSTGPSSCVRLHDATDAFKCLSVSFQCLVYFRVEVQLRKRQLYGQNCIPLISLMPGTVGFPGISSSSPFSLLALFPLSIVLRRSLITYKLSADLLSNLSFIQASNSSLCAPLEES